MSSADYHLRELEIARSEGSQQKNLVRIPEGARRILDIGCGAGQTLLACEWQGAQAVGVDYDLSALRLGRSLTESILFLQCQGERLPFREGSFDFVLSRVALPYMDIAMALREVARVLRPGGRVWLSLHPLSMLSWKVAVHSPKTLAFECYRLVNTVGFHLTGKVFRYPLKRSRVESYQTQRGMRLALEAAGFRDVCFEQDLHFVVKASKDPTGGTGTRLTGSNNAP